MNLLTLLRKLALHLCKEYLIFYIYGYESSDSDVDQKTTDIVVKRITDMKELLDSPDDGIHKYVDTPGEDVLCFGAWKNGELASVCWVYKGEEYRRRRNFWPLQTKEAKLARAYTVQKFRRQGIASSLFYFVAEEMKKSGYTRIYCRIWHSNLASKKAFGKAGWQKIALVIEIKPRFVIGPIRFVRRFAVDLNHKTNVR